MKEKISGIVGFIGIIGWGLFGSYVIIDDSMGSDGMDGFLLTIAILIFVPVSSIILYIIWTKFGGKNLTESDKIKFQNELLEELIKQKELKKKLEE